jgi:hypothetical protein
MSKELEMHDLKNKLSTLAERIAREGFGKQLDYSVESIKEVECILAVIHCEYKSTGSEDGLQGIAMEFGAYIVKVIEQNFGPAEWQRNDESFGEDTFPLQWRGSTLFPVGWCLKRILDGAGDDVWFKFQTLVTNHEMSSGA